MSIPQPIDHLKVLEELESRIAELVNESRLLREQAKTWAEKRDALNAQTKKKREEAKELRNQRDKLNEQIKKMKLERNSLHRQIAPRREELETLRKKMDELSNRGNTRFIAERIEELDWEIQTNPLSPAEEKELVSRVKILEEQMLVCKEAKLVRDRLLELRSEFGSLRISANDIHEKMTDLAKQSQEIHERMLAKIREAEDMRPEADDAHAKFSELRTRTDEAYKGYAEAVAQAKAIRLQMRNDRENEEKRRIEAAVAAGSEEALKKLREKRKITLEEFKILRSKGLI